MEISLTYEGRAADRHILDFYDASRALAGFERSLALVTHLVLHGEIITQAPSLKGAKILIQAPTEGSWRVAVAIVGAAFTVGAVGKDSPVGQIVTSIYDYVLFSSMGFHVDYDKTLQQQYHDHLQEKGITKAKLDSLIEKCETSIVDIHRPIVASKSAKVAQICGRPDGHSPAEPLGPEMSAITHSHLVEEVFTEEDETFVGKVSSYNINTFKGRIFLEEEGRTVPFKLTDSARRHKQTSRITRSLRLNDADSKDDRAKIEMVGIRALSRNGRLKSLYVSKVNDHDPAG